jgi:uncharacterized metal-binding protein YceD (DUF177 family)
VEKSKYLVEIGRLKNGIHEFEFHMDDSFFTKFENSLLKDSSIDVLLTIDKKSMMALADFTFTGTLSTLCDRCLEPLVIEIEGYNELLVRFEEKTEDKDEEMDVVYLSGKEHELDISQYLYEYICLQIPYRNVHPDDEKGNPTCDPGTLKEIEKHLTHEHAPDPRWEILKKINLN